MKRISSFLIISAIILIACNKTDNNANVDLSSMAVHGSVVDEQGNPVADAEVCVIPDLPTKKYIIGSDDPYSNKNPKIQIAEIIGFVVAIKNNYAEITWQTAIEINNSKFILERAVRQSGTGLVFKPIDSVNSQGNSNQPKSYKITDNTIQANTNYGYRLKIVDNDRCFRYYPTTVLEILDSLTYILGNSPNPFVTYTRIDFSVSKALTGSFEVTEKSTGISFLKSSNSFMAGRYTYGWYCKNILSPDTNQAIRPGVYVATLKTTDTVISHNMIYAFKFDTTNCIIPLEVTKTDKYGKFVIPYNYFPDYQEVNRTDEAGRVLGKFNYGISANIVVRKTVENNLTQNVYLLSQNRILVDKSKVVDLDCKMQRRVVKK